MKIVEFVVRYELSYISQDTVLFTVIEGYDEIPIIKFPGLSLTMLANPMLCL